MVAKKLLKPESNNLKIKYWPYLFWIVVNCPFHCSPGTLQKRLQNQIISSDSY